MKGWYWKPRWVYVSVFFVLCSLLSGSLALAEERVLTLNEAYTLAIREYESVRIAKEGLYQFEQLRRKAISNILPTLSADANYTKFAEQKSSALTVIQPDYSYNYSLRLGVPLYQGGREWSALRQAKYRLDVAEKGVLIAKEDVIMAVSNAYYGILKIEKEIEIKEADLKRAEERSRVAQARFKVGEVTKALVLRAEAEVAGIQADLAKMRKDLLIAQDNLARLAGIPPGFILVEPPLKKIPTEGIDDLIKIALDKRKDYLQAKSEEEVAREGIRYARGGFMPTLRLEGVYFWRDQDPIKPEFFSKESIYATMTLSFPFYEGGLRVAEVREAESKLREAELKRINLKKGIELEAREALYTIEAINSALEFYRKQVSFAEENYNTVFKQFTYGLATNVDVIDANSTLVAAQESLANSSIDLQLAIIELERRIGILIEEVKTEGGEVQYR